MTFPFYLSLKNPSYLTAQVQFVYKINFIFVYGVSPSFIKSFCSGGIYFFQDFFPFHLFFPQECEGQHRRA